MILNTKGGLFTTIKALARIVAMLAIVCCAAQNCIGQIVLRQYDTTYNNWRYAVCHMESFYINQQNSKVDTLSGTAFLVNDGDRFYLVTAKHLVQADIYKKDQQLINSKINIKTMVGVKEGMQCDFSQSGNSARPSYFLSSDDEDIAIISLQNKKSILDYLLKGCRALSLNLFDDGTYEYRPEEQVLTSGSDTFLLNGRKSITFGLGIDTIAGSYGKFVTIDGRKLQGSDGSPVMGGNKLIGMMTRQTGINTNTDIIEHPYHIAHSATVIKTPYILQALKSLQK